MNETQMREQIEGLRHMTVGQLKEKYLEAFGEASRSNHKQFLFRRVAWRLQANAWGGLSERARRRALEIANDADLRIRAGAEESPEGRTGPAAHCPEERRADDGPAAADSRYDAGSALSGQGHRRACPGRRVRVWRASSPVAELARAQVDRPGVCAVYTRQSVRTESDLTSCQVQRELCADFAVGKGFQVVEEQFGTSHPSPTGPNPRSCGPAPRSAIPAGIAVRRHPRRVSPGWRRGANRRTPGVCQRRLREAAHEPAPVLRGIRKGT